MSSSWRTKSIPLSHAAKQSRRYEESKMFKTSLRIYDKTKSNSVFVNTIRRRVVRRRDERSLLILLVHIACERDNLKLLEEFVLKNRDVKDLEAIVDVPMGTHQYTGLCRSCFRGSIRMIQTMLTYGADVTHKNAHDETMLHAIESGRAFELKRKPDWQAMFVRDRYDTCRDIICRWTERARSSGTTRRSKRPFVVRKLQQHRSAFKIQRLVRSFLARRRKRAEPSARRSSSEVGRESISNDASSP